MAEPALQTAQQGPRPGPSRGHPDPDVAQVIYEVGAHLDVSYPVMLAAFEAALVESGMQNLDYGDRDSIGVFQQRPSQGWGTAEQCSNVNYAAHQFFAKATAAAHEDPTRGPSELAQAVQRSAYPHRYEQREAQAKHLLAEAQDDAQTPPPGHDPADLAEAGEARFKHTLKYIYGEMIRNQNSAVVWAIKVLYQVEGVPQLLDPSHLAAKLFHGVEWLKWVELVNDGLSRTPALALFYVKVAPGRDWDHKPKIERMLHLDPHNDDQHYFKIPRDEHNREVYYDIWSNMHYGYVGRAAGIEEGTLLKAPDLPGSGLASPSDDISTQGGMELWDRYEDNLTIGQFRDKVYQVIERIDEHRPNLAQVRPWRPH